MFSFIRRHWIAYLVGAIIALVLGFALAFVVGKAGSTPEAMRAEEVSAEAGTDQ